MRIGILTQYYPPEMGAPQARLSEIAKRFVDIGHEVYVLTAMPSYPRGRLYPGYGGVYRKEQIDGVNVIRTCVYPTKSVSTVRRLASYFSFVLSSLVCGAVSLPKLDCLLTESPPLFLGISGFLLSRLKRAKWIFNVSDLWPESAVRLGLLENGLSLRLAQRLEAFCYRKSWLVTGQSKTIVEDIRLRFPDVSVYHLSNGTDTELFNPSFRSENTRRELAKDNQCIAIYAGLHGIAQGLEKIIQAAAGLDDTSLAFIFVGDGPEKERLQSLARTLHNVRFLEPIPREAMPRIMASADIAIVSLKGVIPGAVPSKIYEAMGSGVPVVLLATGEAADIVNETHAGIALQPGDIEALSKTLRHLADNPELRGEFGRFGRIAACSSYNRIAIADAFASFLEHSLDPATPRLTADEKV